MAQLPFDAHIINLLSTISERFKKSDSVYYMDMWPFSPPLMVLSSPGTASQAIQQHTLRKPPALTELFRPITGGQDLIFMNGETWKKGRSVFNPGFNPSHLISQVPAIVEEVITFKDILQTFYQKGRAFQLDPVTLNLTLDVIARITLDTQLHHQKSPHTFGAALQSQMSWLSLGNEFNILKRWNPARPFVQWYNAYVMDSFLDKELDKHFQSRSEAGGTDNSQLRKIHRSIIGLSAESYMKEKSLGRIDKKADRAFREFTKTQIRTFLFAGHDTTSSSMCYAFYLLSKHQAVLEKVRAEHDSIFGKDHGQAALVLSNEPRLINQVPYTTAVIKEALRLFPPSSSMREGSPECSIVGPDGSIYPTDGTLIWVLHQSLHRNPAYWIRPDDFLPERWLVGADDPLHPPKDAWRPFEFGPRNCLGQELAMLEVKVVLILVCRDYDVQSAYDEWDLLHPKEGPKTVKGDRMYQVERVGAHPADGFPCKVHPRI
ncbi:MAG: hypothetical protein Q9166_002643 [cf. Caloplaca sp. 2 TL-2023]